MFRFALAAAALERDGEDVLIGALVVHSSEALLFPSHW